jgi:hypothetical protein
MVVIYFASALPKLWSRSEVTYLFPQRTPSPFFQHSHRNTHVVQLRLHVLDEPADLRAMRGIRGRSRLWVLPDHQLPVPCTSCCNLAQTILTHVCSSLPCTCRPESENRLVTLAGRSYQKTYKSDQKKKSALKAARKASLCVVRGDRKADGRK